MELFFIQSYSADRWTVAYIQCRGYEFRLSGSKRRPSFIASLYKLMRGTEDYRLLEQLRLRFPQKADNLLKNIYAAMFHNKTPRELLCPAAMDSVESVYCMEYSVYEAARKAIIEALTEE